MPIVHICRGGGKMWLSILSSGDGDRLVTGEVL